MLIFLTNPLPRRVALGSTSHRVIGAPRSGWELAESAVPLSVSTCVTRGHDGDEDPRRVHVRVSSNHAGADANEVR
jgi:hypothetical protein